MDVCQQLLIKEGYLCGTAVKIDLVLGEEVAFWFFVGEKYLWSLVWLRPQIRIKNINHFSNLGMIMSIRLCPPFCAVLLDILPLLGWYFRALTDPVPILFPRVLALLLARYVHSLAILVIDVHTFFYERHLFLHDVHVHFCWLFLLGPFPVVEEADYTIHAFGLMDVPKQVAVGQVIVQLPKLRIICPHKYHACEVLILRFFHLRLTMML